MSAPKPLFATRLCGLLCGAVLFAGPAFAHHPMGGTTPATFADGLLSGLGHPVLGLDHLAALIGVGLLAARFTAAAGLALPFAWLAAMGIGVGAHLNGLHLPLAEGWVALGVIAVGLAAALRPTLPPALAALLFAAAGFAHGHALGEAVVGAEATPVAAYLAGLVAVQAAVTIAVAGLARRLWTRSAAEPSRPAPLALRFAGLALALAGVAALTVGLPALA